MGNLECGLCGGAPELFSSDGLVYYVCRNHDKHIVAKGAKEQEEAAFIWSGLQMSPRDKLELMNIGNHTEEKKLKRAAPDSTTAKIWAKLSTLGLIATMVMYNKGQEEIVAATTDYGEEFIDEWKNKR